jgi:DNA-binding NtrC family response regulator
VPVLLIGRTGSGKERFARALHDLGGTGRPFQAINCATLPPNLADAELFGYKRGAFTGAERAYAGRLYAAHGGTLFLDEIADLPLPSQAKLLRALDTGEISPLGNATPFRFEARIVSACQVPLTALVAAGKFREDLAARLSGLVVVLPEVRERRADVPALFHTFLQRHARATAPLVSTRFYERLCLHDWPGNVREIELLARRLLALHGLEPLFRRSHLPDMLRGQGSVSDPTVEAAISPKRRNARDVEKFSVALEEAGGNVRRAAAATGISRQRAYRLIGSHRLTGFVAHSREGAREDADEHDQ